MLFLWVRAPNDDKIFNVLNQEMYYIEWGVGHNKLTDNEKERSDVDVTIDFWDDIVLKYVLDDMCITHKALQ